MKEVIYSDFNKFSNACDTNDLFVCELVLSEDILVGCTEFSYNMKYDRLTVKINGISSMVPSVDTLVRLHNLDNGVYILPFKDYILWLKDKKFRKRVYGYECINTVVIHQYICTKFLFWFFRHVDMNSAALVKGYSVFRLEELCDMLISNIRNSDISFDTNKVIFKLETVTFSFNLKDNITEEEIRGRFAKYQVLEPSR